MPTSVHIPEKLLVAVDKKARTLKISRNKLIVQALEQAVRERTWPEGFFDHFRARDAHVESAVDEMMVAIAAGRTSKPPPKL